MPTKNQIPPLPVGGDGVDLDGNAADIPDSCWRRLKNLIPDRKGNLVKRGSMGYERTLYGVAVGEPRWLASLPFGSGQGDIMLANFFASASVEYDYLAASIDMAGSQFAACQLRAASGAAPEILPSVVMLTNKAYFFNGKLDLTDAINTNGLTGAANNGLIIESKSTAPNVKISPFVFAGSGNSNLNPYVAASYKKRMVYGNFGPGYESHIVFSDRWQPTLVGDDVLLANGRHMIVGQSRGDSIVGIKEVMMQGAGSPAQSGLLVLKSQSAHMILGEPAETTDVSSYFNTLEVNEVSNNAGCVSQHTFAVTPWGIIWCGPDDVWFMAFGAAPMPIGRRIRPMLKAQPPSMLYKIHGAYSDGFYRLALFSDGQGPSSHSPLGEQWWLDLRDGPPSNWTEARWYGPQVFKPQVEKVTSSAIGGSVQGTYFMCGDLRAGPTGKLYGVQYGQSGDIDNSTDMCVNLVSYDHNYIADLATGLVGPRQWRPDTAYGVGDEIVVITAGVLRALVYRCSVAGTSSAGSSWPGTTDNTVTWVLNRSMLVQSQEHLNEIRVSLLSKEYDYGDRKLDKLWQGIEAAVVFSEHTRLRLNAIIDSGKVNQEQTKDRTATDFNLDADTVDGSTLLSSEPDAFAINCDESKRLTGKCVQIELTEENGILIPDAYLSFKFRARQSIAEVPCTATLATNYFASREAFATAVRAAMISAMADQSMPVSVNMNWVTTPTYDAEALCSIGLSAGTWSPKPLAQGPDTQDYDEASAFIWSMLGFVLPNYATYAGSHPYQVDLASAPATQVGTQTPRRLLVGDVGVHDMTMKVRPQRRRPT